MIEQTDPFCLPELTAAALLFDAPWRRFGVVGDLTPRYTNRGWSDRVAKVLRMVRPDVRYLNTSEFGVTTAHQLDGMVEFGPDLLHLPCGPNDILRRDPDFDLIEKTMRRMYDLAAGTGALLTTFTLGRAYVVPAFPDWHERIRAMNAITRRVGAEYEAVVIDMWNHDRIHFSTSGQAVMASEVVRQLAHVLSSRQ
jgi:hypothetical protein